MMNQINAKPQSRKENIRENAISQVIVDAACEVYRTLGGPGLLENVYKQALVIELKQRGLLVEQEKLVINFGSLLLKYGIHRVVNGLDG